MATARLSATTAADEALGELLQAFVNRVSHVRGRTLAVMNEASITLQHVLLLSRLQQGPTTVTVLAEHLHMSLPALSQMVERLFQLDLVTRVEVQQDRRKKSVGLTRSGRSLTARLARARSADYAAGVALLSPDVRAALATALRRAVAELSTG